VAAKSTTENYPRGSKFWGARSSILGKFCTPIFGGGVRGRWGHWNMTRAWPTHKRTPTVLSRPLPGSHYGTLKISHRGSLWGEYLKFHSSDFHEIFTVGRGHDRLSAREK